MLRQRKDDVEPQFSNRTAKTFFVVIADEHHTQYEDYRTLAVRLIYQARKRPLTKQEFDRPTPLLACDIPPVLKARNDANGGPCLLAVADGYGNALAREQAALASPGDGSASVPVTLPDRTASAAGCGLVRTAQGSVRRLYRADGFASNDKANIDTRARITDLLARAEQA